MITIIPAIDIIDGKCVRLTQGDYARKKIYADDPLEVAREFEAAGVRRLHLVDLDGARQGKTVNHRVLESIAAHTQLHIDFGGGLRTTEDVRRAFDCGARQITAGSVAVHHKERVAEWLSEFGAEKIILGADVKNGYIAVSGWQDTSALTMEAFLSKYATLGIRQIISTDVARDGALKGPAFALYESIKKNHPELYLIASGGVSAIEDVNELNRRKIDGVIIGKALYEGKITLKQLESFLC